MSKRALAFLVVQFTFAILLVVIMSACGASSSAPTQTTGNPPPTTTPPAVTPPVTPPTPPTPGTITSINHIIMMFQENQVAALSPKVHNFFIGPNPEMTPYDTVYKQ